MISTEIITLKTTNGLWGHHHQSLLALEARPTITVLCGNPVAKHWLVNLIAKRLTHDCSLAHGILAGAATIFNYTVSSMKPGVITTEKDTPCARIKPSIVSRNQEPAFLLFLLFFFCSYLRLMAIMRLVFGTFFPFSLFSSFLV